MTTDERQKAIEAASRAMAECGYDFPMPVDGDLDDEERGRYDALCAAIDAALAAIPSQAQAVHSLAKRAAEFIWERDPFGDHFSEHELGLLKTLAPQPEDERLRKIIRQAVDAYDNGTLELNSPEIGEPENDIPMHPWHEEWLHYARAAIIAEQREVKL